MVRRLSVVLVVLAGCAAWAGGAVPARASACSAQPVVWPVTGSSISYSQKLGIQSAVRDQINNQLVAHWSTANCVSSFVVPGSSAKYNVQVIAQTQVASTCHDAGDPNIYGCHWWSGGVGYAVVANNGVSGVSRFVSHELLELVVEGGGACQCQAADPVSYASYGVSGYSVSDFAFPRWWWSGSGGPWDEMGVTRWAGDLAWGY